MDEGSPSAEIIIAMSDLWMMDIYRLLSKTHSVMLIDNYELVIDTVRNHKIKGIIVSIGWLLDSNDVLTTLGEEIRNVPAIILISNVQNYKWFSLYQAGLHEFVTIPFDVDELIFRLRVTGMIE